MAVIISLVLIFLGLVFLVLIHVCLSEWFSRTGGGRGSMAAERGANGGRSMSMKDLEKLPCYDYVAKDNNTSNSPVEDCAVCLENLTTGDKCRMLPLCKHSFHAQCVDTWLLKTPICPICRSSAGSSSHSGNQVLVVVGNTNNGSLIEPNSGNNRVQLRESMESGSSRNVGVEFRDNPTFGSPSSSNHGGEVESREHQTGSTAENQ